jgi:hypothetical protein
MTAAGQEKTVAILMAYKYTYPVNFCAENRRNSRKDQIGGAYV